MKKVVVLLVLFVCAGFAFAAEKPRFIAHNNGTVTDTKTGLMWAASDNGADISWGDAASYCKNYRGGGHSDWRLPSTDELFSLHDKTQKDSKGYPKTALIKLSSCCPWTKEERNGTANIFSFPGSSGSQRLTPDIRGLRALPVRGGKK